MLFFKEMFTDADETTMALTLLPMLLYHPVQLITGSILAPRLQAWVASDRVVPEAK